MADELKGFGKTTETLKARIWNASGLAWNVNDGNFSNLDASVGSEYLITLTAATVVGSTTDDVLHTNNCPSGVPAGLYYVQISVDDVIDHEYELVWNGTSEATLLSAGGGSVIE